MLRLLLLSALEIVLASAAHAQQHRQLFNGKNLDGWAWVDNEGFRIEDGAIRTQGRTGMLWYTREKIGNGVLRVVYRMSSPKGNSGIFIRIPEKPTSERDAIHNGGEVQIDDNDDEWHSTGVLYSMTKARARPSKPAGEWNTLEITLDGLRTIVHLNGMLVTDYDGVSPVPERTKSYEPERRPRPESGYIGIQNHDERAILHFKEISLAPLKK
jgi:hypothetical protein